MDGSHDGGLVRAHSLLSLLLNEVLPVFDLQLEVARRDDLSVNPELQQGRGVTYATQQVSPASLGDPRVLGGSSSNSSTGGASDAPWFSPLRVGKRVLYDLAWEDCVVYLPEPIDGRDKSS